MAFGDRSGRAFTDPNRPQGFGVCDRCGEWYNLRELKKQEQWTGPKLSWIGILVCGRCLDVPQPQLRPITLPPDPVPLVNPRPEAFGQDSTLLGFTSYVMWAGGFPIPYTSVLTDQNGDPILFGGNPVILGTGTDGVALLSQLAQMTGIPIPGTIQSRNGTIAQAGVAQSLVGANPSRSYIAIFNPCSAPIGVCTAISVAELGVAPTINIGFGGCLFWATAQGYGVPYGGAMTVVGEIPGVPYYAYEAP